MLKIELYMPGHGPGRDAAYHITRRENTTFTNSQTIISQGFVVLFLGKQFPFPRFMFVGLQSATSAVADESLTAILFNLLRFLPRLQDLVLAGYMSSVQERNNGHKSLAPHCFLVFERSWVVIYVY